MDNHLMKGVKNILFDLGGVIIDLDRSRVIDAFKAIGCEMLGNTLDNSVQQGLFLELDEGRITPAQFHSRVRSLTGTTATDKEIDDAFNRFIVGIPAYKLTMLRTLRRNYNVIMLSNSNAIMFESIIPRLFTAEGLTIDDYFDHIFVSYRMGISKPHARCFNMVCRQAGILPQETLFLDDARTNIDAAARLGFKTYHARPHENFTHIFGLDLH